MVRLGGGGGGVFAERTLAAGGGCHMGCRGALREGRTAALSGRRAPAIMRGWGVGGGVGRGGEVGGRGATVYTLYFS